MGNGKITSASKFVTKLNELKQNKTMITNETLEEYQKILNSDPKSKVFAPLADGYRERGMLEEALKVCEQGLKYNPNYASGHLAMGRILQAQSRFHEALKYFNEAVKLSPDNLLAFQLLGDTFVALKQAKEALKAYKMALFIDPKLEKAQKAVKQLEAITSEEYEADLFEMKKTSKSSGSPLKVQETLSHNLEDQVTAKLNLDREISYIDALLVRGDIQKAEERLEQVLPIFPGEPELLKRYSLLKPSEIPTPIRPQISREKRALEQKRKALHKLEKAIELRKALIAKQHLTST
jgi:tetratricopeptide (TPR) repeat protein